MELEWVGRGLVTARVGDRSFRVGGEYLVEHDPDFLICARSVTTWDDGAPISEPERTALLDEVVDAAAQQGWKFGISWEEFDWKEAVERYLKSGQHPEDQQK